MKVIVATKETQGTEPTDYSWTVDGELVTPVRVACSDPACGCSRGFPGLASSRATTTVVVADLPHIDPAALHGAVEDSLARSGWLDLVGEGERDELVWEHVEAIAEIAAAFPAGTVLSREGDVIFQRRGALAT